MILFHSIQGKVHISETNNITIHNFRDHKTPQKANPPKSMTIP